MFYCNKDIDILGTIKKERVIVYVDGFNLYFGMTSKFSHVKWLDLISLASDLLQSHQKLVEVRYYTAMITKNNEKIKRQIKYVDTLKDSGVIVILGKYKVKERSCRKCNYVWQIHEEKITDVNISVELELVIDAMKDRYDTALLISGDTDLIPPINAVHSSFLNKRVLVAFPPNRKNKELVQVAKGSFVIGRKKLVDNQFDSEVILKNGFRMKIPDQWT